MNHPSAVFGLSLVLSLTSVAAQERPARPVPSRGPFLSVSLAGPKLVRQAILPTNLGALFGAPETGPMRAMIHKHVRALFDDAEDSADLARAWGSVQQSLLGYSGTIEMQLYIDRQGKRNGRPEHDVSGHILLSPDKRTDFAKLQKEIRKLCLTASGEEPKKESIDGGVGPCEFFGRAGDDGISLPMRYREDYLVVFFGSKIDKAIWQGMRRLDKTWAQRKADGGKRQRAPRELLSVDLDWREAGQFMKDEFSRRPDEARVVGQFFGVDTWDKMRFRVRTAGPHLQFEVQADFLPGDRGVLAALLPDIQELPAALHRVPADAERGFVAGHVRWKKLYWTILTAFSGAGRGKPKPMDELKAETNREAGFDVDADLLDHVGTDVLVMKELSEPDQAKEARRHEGDGLCFVFRIKNDAAFAKTYETIMAKKHVRKEPPIERGGVEVQPIRIFGRGEFFALTAGRFFYAIGDRGLTALTAYLGRAAKPSGETVDPTLPESLRRVKNQAPPGFNLAGLIPIRFFSGRFGSDILWEVWREVGLRRTSREKLRADVRSVLPVLKKYRLDRWYLLGGFERRQGGGGSARIRLVW